MTAHLCYPNYGSRHMRSSNLCVICECNIGLLVLVESDWANIMRKRF